MRKVVFIVLVCIIPVLATTTPAAQRRSRSPQRRSASTTRVTEKSAVEIKAGRDRVATQIKTLTQFLYLLGGIAKDLESADKATSGLDAASTAIERNRASKTKIRASIRNVREGLDKLESDFRLSPVLRSYYPYISGVAIIGETAENQAAANRINEAGKSLIKVVDRLADALAAMR
jgi:hypothetical protein